jgi:hypothetical protein
LTNVLACLSSGERPSPAEFLALDIESGVDPGEARRYAARYADAIAPPAPVAPAPVATARDVDAMLAALLAFQLRNR